MMASMFRMVYAVAFIATLTSCGTSPYREQKMFMFTTFGGYTDTHMGGDNWLVTYDAGNQRNRNSTKVYDFALYRAAQIASDQGSDFFTIQDKYLDSGFCRLSITLQKDSTDLALNSSVVIALVAKRYGI